MAHLISVREETVTDGEQKMLDYLKLALPSDWFIISNPTISIGRRNRELDAIVISDRYIWAIDDKAYNGKITGDINVWILPDGTQIPNVLDKIKEAARVVKGKIVKKNPSLQQVWVEPLILLSSDNVEIDIEDDGIPFYVRSLRGCEEYFLQPGFPNASLLSESDLQGILRCLAGDIKVDKFLSALNKKRKDSRVIDVDDGAVYIQFDGEGGFRRVFYEDTVIGRNEMRGVQPKYALESLRGTGFRLHFHGGKISLTVLNGLGNARLGQRQLKPGEWVPFRKGSNTLQIGDIRLRASVFKLPDGDRDE